MIGFGTLAGDLVNGRDALVRGHVGEHQPADDVADRVDVLLGRAHPAVDLDEAPVELDLRSLEPQIFGVRRPAGRNQQLIDLEFFGRGAFGPDAQRHAVVGHLHGRCVEPSARNDLDPASDEAPLERGAQVRVLERDDRRQVFQQRHRDSEVVIHRGELGPHRSGSDDRDAPGQIGFRRHVVRGDDPATVGNETGQALDPRPVATIRSWRSRPLPRSARPCRPRR